MSEMLIRPLKTSDVAQLFDTFSKLPEFGTGGDIKFYDEAELEYWSHDKQSLFLVVEYEGKLVGFSFTKYISPSWAMLDGFYILYEYRDKGLGTDLWEATKKAIEAHGTEYISTLCNSGAIAWLYHRGFDHGDDYMWMEKWTDAPRTSVGRLGWK